MLNVSGRLVVVCAGTGQPAETLRLVGTTDDEDVWKLRKSGVVATDSETLLFPWLEFHPIGINRHAAVWIPFSLRSRQL